MASVLPLPYLPSLLLQQQRAAAGRRRGRTPGSRRSKPKDLQTPRGSTKPNPSHNQKHTNGKPIGEETNRELLPVLHSLSILIGVFLKWSRVPDKLLNRLVHPHFAAVHLLSL